VNSDVNYFTCPP